MKNTKSKRGIGFFTGLLLLVNAVFLLLLLLAYTAYHVRPDFLPYIAFAGLAYPFILLANLVFVAIWLFLRPRFAIIPLIIILIGWNHIGRLFQFSGGGSQDDARDRVKVMSYNLQNFLKVNTSTTKYVTDFKNEADILEFLKKEDADIVCLQEMLHDRDNRKKFAGKMARDLNCPNYHFVNYFTKNTKVLDAIATFTRFPIIESGDLEYDNKSIGIFTDLVIKGDTIRVYNLHLASIHFKKEDYEFWSELPNEQEQEKITAGTYQIMSKMQLAFLKRAGQSDVVMDHMEKSPFPVIICGDFNDTPSSYAYNRLSQNKKDAFVESGAGLGITYAGKFFPAFRIDFILYDEVFHNEEFMRHKIPFSDHYPVTTYLYLN